MRKSGQSDLLRGAEGQGSAIAHGEGKMGTVVADIGFN